MMPLTRQAETLRQHSLNLLHKLHPAQAAILVGAAPEKGWPEIPAERIVRIDAEADRLLAFPNHSGEEQVWHRRHTLLAERSASLAYHMASNPAENGLIPPEALQVLWPNLRATDTSERTSQTLEQVLDEPELASIAASTNTWLVIDCLPALRILQGAGKYLETCNLLWLRALLKPLNGQDNGTTLAELDSYLAPLHYQRILCFEENHPGIVQVVFLRDDIARQKEENLRVGSLASERQSRIDALTRENADLAAARDMLTSERDQQAGLAAERQSRIDALTRGNADLAAARDSLAAERDQQAGLAAERQSRIDALTRENADLAAARDSLAAERDQQASLAAERQSRIDALTRENADLAAARDTLAAERDQQAGLATERQSRIDALTRENADLAAARDTLAAERDQQARLAAERQSRIDALTRENTDLAAARDSLAAERDQQAGLAAERQSRIDALTRENADLAAARDSLAAERDQQTRLATERHSQVEVLAKEKAELLASHKGMAQENERLASEYDSRIGQLDVQLQESHERQRLMQDELVKSAAQIALIKDLLLQEREI